MDKRLGGCLYYLPQTDNPVVFVRECVDRGLTLSLNTYGIKVKKYKTFAEIFSSAFNEKNIAFLLSWRFPVFFLKKIFLKKGFEIVCDYIIVPNFNNPRWFLPKNKILIKKCGNIVKPSSLKAITAWQFMRLFNWLGYPQFLFPSQLLLLKRKGINVNTKGILKDYFANIFKINNFDFILYTGTYGYYQKFNAQIMDKEGNIIAYAKIGHNEQTKKRIIHEVKILELLNNMSLLHIEVPKIILKDNLPYSSDTILIQSPPPNAYKKIIRNLEESHIIALVELFQKTAKEHVNGDILLRKLRKSFLNLVSYKTILNNKEFKDIFTIMGKTLEILDKSLNDSKITLGLSHGDFTPWNVYMGDNNLFIFDWELADFRAPLWDIYNFILHTEILIHKRDDRVILRKIVNNGSLYAHLIEKYLYQLNEEVDLNKYTSLTIYLFEILTYYIKYVVRQTEAGFKIDKETKKIINISAKLLREIIKSL